MPLNIAVLASTRATDMQAIIDAIEAGMLDAKIQCVVSDAEHAYALERAKKHGIDAIFINPDGKSKEQYDAEVLKELEKRNVELVLLVGYMRLVRKPLLDRFENRIMNIHPSLLPAFAGGKDMDVHQLVLDAGCKVTGCTLHFVTDRVDAGPIILQKAVAVGDDDTAGTLKEKVQKAEQELLLEGIRFFNEGKILVKGNKTRIRK